jgi:hypothetical protein|tara:strand:+ start:2683 stop:3414 length:732 start_codon:yes stop_codon:yes gene_type:complete
MEHGMKEAALTGADLKNIFEQNNSEIFPSEDDVALVSYIRGKGGSSFEKLLSHYEITSVGVAVDDLVADIEELTDEEVAKRLFSITQGTYVPKWLSYKEPMRTMLRREERLSLLFFADGGIPADEQLIYLHDFKALIEHLYIRREKKDGILGEDLIDDYHDLKASEIKERLHELTWFESPVERKKYNIETLSRAERDALRFSRAQEEKIISNQNASANAANKKKQSQHHSLKLFNDIKKWLFK